MRNNPTVKGEQAQQLMKDPLLKEAMTGIDEMLVKQLRDMNMTGSEGDNLYALELVRCLQANKRITSWLGQVLNTGKLQENEAKRKSMLNSKGI